MNFLGPCFHVLKLKLKLKTNLYSAIKSEDSEALRALQKDARTDVTKTITKKHSWVVSDREISSQSVKHVILSTILFGNASRTDGPIQGSCGSLPIPDLS